MGVPIAWRTPHLTYAFNEKGFPGIEDADLRSMFAQSFSTWEHAKCDGKSVGLHSTAARETTSLTVGPKENEPNTNVIVHFDPAEWSAHEMSPQAFAITAVWFSDAGVILGADMMFNGRMDPFGACSDDGCVATDPHVDLQRGYARIWSLLGPRAQRSRGLHHVVQRRAGRGQQA